MAGGGGTRLWPLSTQDHPKHLLNLTGDVSIYEKSVRRLLPMFSLDEIFIVTVKNQAEKLMQLTPEIPTENFIIEPEPKGTASVIGLAAIVLQRRDQDCVMVVLTSDHLIGNTAEFLEILDMGCMAAEDGGLITIGIQPTYPATGYGYIEVGEKWKDIGNRSIFMVKKFKEKPGNELAEVFFRSKNNLWNSGMFIWKTSAILAEMKVSMPSLYASLMQIKSTLSDAAGSQKFVEIWAQIKPETIDFGIMEKAKDIMIIPAKEMDWNDIGSWVSLFDFLHSDQNGNISLGGEVIWQETTSSLVVQEDSRKLVAAIGLKDIVIIDTNKALLVCLKSDVQKVREIVARLKAIGRNEYI